LQVELVIDVSRGDDDRLSGTVRTVRNPGPRQDSGVREFSGTLELMRVFEELVPGGRAGPQAHGADGGGLIPGPSGPGVQ
jgi:hypothetical protein